MSKVLLSTTECEWGNLLMTVRTLQKGSHRKVVCVGFLNRFRVRTMLYRVLIN